MRRWSGIALSTTATLVVVVALLVSGLRLALVHLNQWRPVLLAKITSMTGVPVAASELSASWRRFGPALQVRDLHLKMKDGAELSVKQVSLALDIWQSLLHLRWQFRDLNVYQLCFVTERALGQENSAGGLEPRRLSDIFLHQFDYFDLQDSRISFLTPSGQPTQLMIPRLRWLNSNGRHRVEGQGTLSAGVGQESLMQVRADLHDNNGLLNNGRVWLRADDVDVRPWLERRIRDNIGLERARFSLEAWMTLAPGDVARGHVWLKQGTASWRGNNNGVHQFSFDDLSAAMTRETAGWLFSLPAMQFTLDGKRWPGDGKLALAWLAKPVSEASHKGDAELRVRASNIDPDGLSGLLPLVEKFSPSLGQAWRAMQPGGKIERLALDIPLSAPQKTRFLAAWKNMSWKQWKRLPGVAHLSGEAMGSVENGRLIAHINRAKMPWQGVFRAPLEIEKGGVTLNWLDNEKGFSLEGHNVDIAAKALRLHGDFRYRRPVDDEPWLSILAGIRSGDVSQAWRYFPENLMGTELVNYLSAAIQGGEVDNATLVYGGDPGLFPYHHNEGQFEVWVPLRNATFTFQPDWPTLKNLDIDLDFINHGLWMKANNVMLGGMAAHNLSAIIPDYGQNKLIINADITGPGDKVGPWFSRTPLKSSLAATLDQLRIVGNVSARLHLDIPLDEQRVTAKGEISLNNNNLYIKPLDSVIKNISGQFSFVNGDLSSKTLRGSWFSQPVNFSFTSKEEAQRYRVAVNMSGDWQLPGALPWQLNNALSGTLPWNGKVNVELPYNADARYDAALSGDFKNVSSRLPAPLDKAAGEALPVTLHIAGNQQSVELAGRAGGKHSFNSRWLLKQKLTLDRAIWVSDRNAPPPLPAGRGVELNLPPLDGARWLALLRRGMADNVSGVARDTQRVTLRTPALMLAGQRWNNLRIVAQSNVDGTTVSAQGSEIDGTLRMRNNAPWQAAIRYLNYNPGPADRGTSSLTDITGLSPRGWPDLQLRCSGCWFRGRKYGRIDGDVSIQGDTLKLTNGLLDTGFARMTADGEWVNDSGKTRTSLKGKLRGDSMEVALRFFDLSSPVGNASFDIDYDLHWRNVPWQPDESTLNGILRTRLGKGEISELNTGHVSQLLRLLSFDALLRKLRFDFSDTFSDGFWFDSIRSTAWIKDGIAHTDDTLLDGLAADIAMKGTINLARRELDLEAVVAPEISATVGVAAAFAVNPLVGAAVFAASKALGPLWSTVSVLRYRITGTIEKPLINEVFRQPGSVRQ